MAKENDISVFLTAFRMLSVVFLLVGLGLLGYAGYQLLLSFFIVNDKTGVRVDGEFVDYDAEVSSLTHAGGHVETMVWFPRPVFKFKNKAGQWRTVRDPNIHFWKKFKEGDRVPVIVLAGDYDAPDEPYPFARLTDAHTRFFYHGAVFLLGLIFFVLSIGGGMILRTPATETPAG